MKAGLFIKLAMSKLSPVPVYKQIAIENKFTYKIPVKATLNKEIQS